MSKINSKMGCLTVVQLSVLLLVCSCASFDVRTYTSRIDASDGTQQTACATTHDTLNIAPIACGRKYDASVRDTNYTRVLCGKNDTAVILLHGFIGSPFEVYYLGQQLNTAGYTVYMPLLQGFGGDTDLANRTGYNAWQSTVKESLDVVCPHYSKVVVIGFSLGGTVVSDFLLNGESSCPTVKGAVLLAPYYSPSVAGGKVLNNMMAVFTDSISLKKLYQLSANDDLKIPVSNPEYYNSDMPLKAVKEIVKYGEMLREQEHSMRVGVPVLFVYTEDDQTVNNKVSAAFIERNFSNSKTIKFSKEEKVRHQLAVPVGNDRFDYFCETVISFIETIDD
ncbi:hypothetical protein DSLASN_11010 [Desulfoluna limicola]|uniref:Serine aminopeptidase S33 domain-containing protein n=1 Tax=Desulfoluna limicola TaxID=2810562 RepID=A0ABM7PE85_9BACT|nr:alpha/beta fold hydrolase [Desulfoluna limicola]BCS95469.1 hypothetical protein DSLASN_11010 [Desulfoluna limicola]